MAPTDPVRIINLEDIVLEFDDVAVQGLLGTPESLPYILAEIETHLHGYERWFGLATAPVGETHRADRIGAGVAAFQADAGNNTWGAWLQILGSTDTPDGAGMARYDMHRFMFTAVERSTSVHFVQVAFGASGAAALAAGTYTEFVFKPQSATAEETPVNTQEHPQPAGTKAWLRVLVPGQNTGTMDFYLGLHEYKG
jgi:hypothetical protein